MNCIKWKINQLQSYVSSLNFSDKVILEVEKITSDTYAGETTYTAEEFILLEIYPKTNGTVTVTYGGLTKTITDTSGAEEPNAQQVYFGTFYGVSDSVTTPVSGELTIEGDYYAFGQGLFKTDKMMSYRCACVTKVRKWGSPEVIPDYAFAAMMVRGDGRLTGKLVLPNKIKHIGANSFLSTEISGDLVLPLSVENIGSMAFSGCTLLTSITIGENVCNIGYEAFNMTSRLQRVIVLPEYPPEITPLETTDESGNTYIYYQPFGKVPEDGDIDYRPEQIIVPKGSGDMYKTAVGWSDYADLIEEAN